MDERYVMRFDRLVDSGSGRKRAMPEMAALFTPKAKIYFLLLINSEGENKYHAQKRLG